MANILVADDQEVIRSLVREVLEDLGHSVTIAEDGLAALECCKSDSYDLVITDICMPGKEGVSVLRSIKANYPQTRVIAFSAAMDRETYLKTATDFGADAAVEKNGDIETLTELVDRFLQPTN